MSELASEIRRIARGDKLKGPLSGALERDPIGGTFVPFTNTPLSQITANGAEGEEPADVNSTESTGDSQTGSDQPTNGDNPNTFNKGSATAGSTSNTYDIEDVIEGTAGVPSSPNETDYSQWDSPPSTGGIIDHLTGATDCGSGQCINFHLNGNFPAPEGWEDADTPPVDDSWIDGYYYEEVAQSLSQASGNYIDLEFPQSFSTTLNQNKAEMESRLAQVLAAQDAQKPGLAPHSSANGVELISNAYRFNTQDRLGTNRVGSTSNRILCSSSPNPTYCLSEAPTEEAWPEDGCYDLALIDGSLQKNQYDSEAPDGAGGSKVDFCYTPAGGGSQTATVEVTANGGFMLYKTSGGAPTGQATVYGDDGTFQARGDATESFMDQWRPK